MWSLFVTVKEKDKKKLQKGKHNQTFNEICILLQKKL